MTSDEAVEFSRPIALSQAHDHAVEEALEALPDECGALAKRFDVRSISSVSAQLHVAPHAQGFCVTGVVTADVVQTCVVTGEAVAAHVEAPINVLLWTQEVEGDLDMLEEAYGVDDIEPIESDDYDLGEMSAQYLALAIDPFPRKKGASLDAILPQRKTNPFSVLSQLKDKA
jgi:uncharacterized metal-binding protein YceD (DUF177 family)